MAPRDTSLQALHDRFAGPLHVFVMRLVDDRQTAEEIVQDTLTRAWRHGDRFDPARGSMASWLFTIARNLATDSHRRRAARPTVVTTLDHVDEPVTDADVDRALEAWQMKQALDGLSDAHRDVIVATYYHGATLADTARQLGVPVGTVKSRLYYGLRALRLRLEEMGVVT